MTLRSIILSTLIVAQIFPLDLTAGWLLDPQQPDQGTPFSKKGTLAFNFPTVDTASYTGNLYLPWTSPLVGSQWALQFQVVTFPTGDKPVRFIPAPGTCTSPAEVHLYFQTGALYNDTEGTRWWSAEGVPLIDSGGTSLTFTVSLDPSMWISTFGHSATELLGEFHNAIQNPTYIGLTFGGNCAFGHGVATAKGTAQFRLVSLELD